jgi:peptide chain release factor 3
MLSADGSRTLMLFTKTAKGGAAKADIARLPLDSPEAATALGDERAKKLRDELEMLEVAGNPFTREGFLAGAVSPVFFGSALTNFGVEPFFDAFVDLAPPPGARPVTVIGGAEPITADPVATPFSAYVFKIQANMNPRHRDSVAFARICSGRFERDLVVRHLHRGELVRELRLSRPHTLMAQERTTLDEAWPGDVVGLINAGFAIGDTLVHQSLKPGFEHKALPQFPPEVFAQVMPADLTKRKQFDKGMLQLAQEGAVQVLRSWDNPQADPFIAAVGRLQFEVLQFRLRDEYNVETQLKPLPFQCSGWLVGDPATFKSTPGAMLAKDARGRAVVLLPSEWDKRYCLGQNPQHQMVDYA